MSIPLSQLTAPAPFSGLSPAGTSVISPYSLRVTSPRGIVSSPVRSANFVVPEVITEDILIEAPMSPRGGSVVLTPLPSIPVIPSGMGGVAPACYLDGRYFNMIFGKYPGLVTQPLKVKVNDLGAVDIDFNLGLIKAGTDPLIRVIIEAPNFRHSALLFIDNDKYQITYYDCLAPINNRYFHIVSNAIKAILPGADSYAFAEKTSNINPTTIVPGCPNGAGMCAAYTVLKAMKILAKKGYDSSMFPNLDLWSDVDIMIFADMVRSAFPVLSDVGVDIEFGFTPVQGAVLGGVTGLALGGLVGGAGGALVGAGLGGLAGYGLAGGFNPAPVYPVYYTGY